MAGMDYDSKMRRDTRPRLLQILTAIFERGIEEGSFRPHDPTHTARMFLGCLLEVFDLQAGGTSNEDVNGSRVRSSMNA